MTAEDITKGVRGCGRNCPVALAVLRVLPSEMTGAVMVVYVTTYSPAALMLSCWLRWERPLPTDVVARIERYDFGEEMEPFDFELEGV